MGALYLGEALQVNSTLTDLYLAGEGSLHRPAPFCPHYNIVPYENKFALGFCAENNIGDEGAEYLAKALRENSTLKTLHLRGKGSLHCPVMLCLAFENHPLRTEQIRL
jgi:hypothetical protein